MQIPHKITLIIILYIAGEAVTTWGISEGAPFKVLPQPQHCLLVAVSFLEPSVQELIKTRKKTNLVRKYNAPLERNKKSEKNYNATQEINKISGKIIMQLRKEQKMWIWNYIVVL